MTLIESACPQRITMPKEYHIPEALLHKSESLDFTPVTAVSMAQLWPYLQKEQGRTCDFSYGGLIMWEPLFHYEYAIYRDTLFIKGRLEGDMLSTAFSLPIGELSIGESVMQLKQWCNLHGEQLRFSAIPEYALPEFQKYNPSVIRELPDWADYLYDIEPLATLKGKKMAKKRNHFNKFNAECVNHIYCELTGDNIADALGLLLKLDAEAEDRTGMAEIERTLALETLHLFATGTAPMYGGILYVDNKVAAFTIGDIKGDTLYVHIEKADRTVPGAYEAINKYFAEQMMALHAELKYINREDDAGDPGLRKAKESYHPVAMLKKYDIIF